MLRLLVVLSSQCHQCRCTLGNSCGYQTNESATSLPGVFVCETGGLPKVRAVEQLFPNGLTYAQPLRPSSSLSSCNGEERKEGSWKHQVVPCFPGHPGAAWSCLPWGLLCHTGADFLSAEKDIVPWGYLKAASAFLSLLASCSPPRAGLWPRAGPKSHLDSGKWELCGPPTLLKLPNKQILKAQGSLCVHSWGYFLCLKEKKADRRNYVLARTCSVFSTVFTQARIRRRGYSAEEPRRLAFRSVWQSKMVLSRMCVGRPLSPASPLSSWWPSLPSGTDETLVAFVHD